MEKTNPSISLPKGVRDVLPEEAAKIRKAEDAVLSVFTENGYSLVRTPLLEYADVLAPGLGGLGGLTEELEAKLLKFIDPASGRIMAIRPDITPQIARIVSTKMKGKPLPLKLCYNESVIRYVRAGEAKTTEIRQAGAEYVSIEATPEIDAEIVITAIEALKSTGITDFKVDLADVGFVRAVIDRLAVSDNDKLKVKDALALKDRAGLEATLKGLGKEVNPDDITLLVNLTSLYGTGNVITEAEKLTSAKGMLGNLKDVVNIIKEKGYGDFITIDLGEVRGFDYYTGIIFEAFAEGLGRPLLSGGRYDSLLGKYGSSGKSTGFAIDVGAVVELQGR